MSTERSASACCKVGRYCRFSNVKVQAPFAYQRERIRVELAARLRRFSCRSRASGCIGIRVCLQQRVEIGSRCAAALCTEPLRGH